MRALVSGAAGFLGSHLTRALLDRGDEVVAVDSFITGTRANLAFGAEREGLSIVEHDVVQPLEVEGGLDAVLHLASPASPPAYLAHPLVTLDVGSAGTRALLELSRRKGATFLLASTSEVYGDPEEHPQREEYWGHVNPVGPRSVYDEAKRCAEAYTMAYHRGGTETRIARIFNTYGELMRPEDGRAIPNFMIQALRDDDLTVYGDGLQTRSLCYVSDLIRGLLLLLDGGDHRPVNLGNPDEVTMLELAERINRLAGGRGQIVRRPLPEDDPRQRCPDISRATELLGWLPEVSLDAGLPRTLAWFQSLSKVGHATTAANPER